MLIRKAAFPEKKIDILDDVLRKLRDVVPASILPRVTNSEEPTNIKPSSTAAALALAKINGGSQGSKETVPSAASREGRDGDPPQKKRALLPHELLADSPGNSPQNALCDSGQGSSPKTSFQPQARSQLYPGKWLLRNG